MTTIRQYVSKIMGQMKALSIDDFISPKFIYQSSISIAQDFLKKDNASNLQVYSITEGWSELPEIEMVEVPITSVALDLYICQKLMKSKYRLPALYTSKVAPLIKEVASVDYSNFYSYCRSFNQWRATQNREYISKRYFLILDGYLYIPVGKKDGETSPEITRMNGYFISKQEVEFFNNKLPCTSCKQPEPSCMKAADYELVIPSYLINDVTKELLNSLLKSKQFQEDVNPNMSSAEKDVDPKDKTK